jgi:hypothetical protein
VCWGFSLTDLLCSGNLYILKHRAKAVTPQAASMKFNMFIVHKDVRNEILPNGFETSREKYIAH